MKRATLSEAEKAKSSNVKFELMRSAAKGVLSGIFKSVQVRPDVQFERFAAVYSDLYA